MPTIRYFLLLGCLVACDGDGPSPQGASGGNAGSSGGPAGTAGIGGESGADGNPPSNGMVLTACYFDAGGARTCTEKFDNGTATGATLRSAVSGFESVCPGEVLESCPRDEGLLGTCEQAQTPLLGSRTFHYVDPNANGDQEAQRRGTELACLQGNGDGVGVFQPEARFDPIEPGDPLSGAVSLALGNSSSCALMEDKTVWCWGSGANGTLGNGMSGGLRWWAEQVQGLEDVVQIEKSLGDFTCAVLENGELRCWGGTSPPFPLDQNEPLPVTEPTLVAGLPPAKGVALSTREGCVLTTEGLVFHWLSQLSQIPTSNEIATLGGTRFGLLDDGQVIYYQTTDEGTGIEGATALKDDHLSSVCVIREGRVSCGARPDAPPGQDVALADVELPALAVSFGQGDGICAVLENGEGWCWKLAGLLTAAVPPARVVEGATSIAMGGNHGCAVLEDTTVSCWGLNESGELGSAVVSNSPASLVLRRAP